MKVLRNGALFKGIKDAVVTLGNFDGIHLGHMKILRKVVERAEKLGCPSVVYTFEPHPRKVVSPEKSPPLITGYEDRAALIKSLGIDYLVLARFTREFAAKHPREFVEEVLVKGLRAREVWVGQNFAFGRRRLGTVEYLKRLGEKFGFRVFAIPPRKKGGAVVSSSRVRELVQKGEVAGAEKLLSRPYSIRGRVVRGRRIGKGLGFPTANLSVESELVPKNGVYAVHAAIGGKIYGAVLNIGVAPTFGEKERTIEVHLLGFRGNIYGRKMEVLFLKRLRDEKHFETEEALAEQIRKDIERARKVFSRTPFS